MHARPLVAVLVAVLAGAVVTSCAPSDAGDRVGSSRPSPESPATASAAPSTSPSPAPSASPSTAGVGERPPWLGTRVLPDRGDGFGEVQDTPSELVDRRLAPPAPQDRPADDVFTATVEDVPDEVLARSTWTDVCPVAADELAYITLTFLGFDGRPHLGELLVHRDVAADVVAAFEAAYAERFPIEEMRVIAPEELDLPPTGDGNVTSAFVCRPVRGSTSWSAHAYGKAVDVNPFHNPYVRDDLVIPELAGAYVDRDHRRPGMLYADSALVRVLRDRGWGWGGTWTDPVDWMHLSTTGT